MEKKEGFKKDQKKAFGGDREIGVWKKIRKLLRHAQSSLFAQFPHEVRRDAHEIFEKD